ncbi:MAG: hypothetical protein M1837_006229 [Sclerophora amabilis]|nr:MAG: hypothetical protein M1837_006229 [Sclerophora amabilis]
MADETTGTKRKSDAPAPAPKREKKTDEAGQEQMTIEESMPQQQLGKSDEAEEIESEEAETNTETKTVPDDAKETDASDERSTRQDQSNGTKAEATESIPADDHKRDKELPSAILEKGIVYFFFRARVGIDEPQGVQDIARSYIVLRPLPLGAQLGDGPLEDVGNNRLLALPKKVLPVSPRDRFMVFVEKANTTVQDLKDNFMAGSDYATKTTGTRHAPAVTPAGEGVYAITSTGRETHLAYILTTPTEMNEVQHELGLRNRGSFVTSAKNPEVSGPANASLPTPAKFSQEILDDFRSRGWMPLQPRLLDYENAQFLVIGEGVGELGKATEESAKDQKQEKETPLEEMETLEHEDAVRTTNLEHDDPVFEDLGLSAEKYPKLQTTW